MATGQEERERLEIDYWATSPTEAPDVDSLDSFTNKMQEARVFLEKLARFRPVFESAERILELGGGQCWTSTILKREYPDRVVIGSDIAPAAVASTPKWERIFGVPLDGRLACRAHEVPVASGSIDLVVVFASAHHFGAHRRTLVELERILRPGGHVLYLHEPACLDAFYPVAYRRVNRKRPVVREDVLRHRRLAELAGAAGLDIEVEPAPTTTARGAVETVYYLALSRLPGLRRVLPCTVDVLFSKPERGGH